MGCSLIHQRSVWHGLFEVYAFLLCSKDTQTHSLRASLILTGEAENRRSGLTPVFFSMRPAYPSLLCHHPRAAFSPIMLPSTCTPPHPCVSRAVSPARLHHWTAPRLPSPLHCQSALPPTTHPRHRVSKKPPPISHVRRGGYLCRPPLSFSSPMRSTIRSSGPSDSLSGVPGSGQGVAGSRQ